MNKKINLPKAYIHTGVTMGPGDVDVEAEMKKSGHPDNVIDQAVKDLTDRVEEHKKAIREGTIVEQGPITEELKEPPKPTPVPHLTSVKQ